MTNGISFVFIGQFSIHHRNSAIDHSDCDREADRFIFPYNFLYMNTRIKAALRYFFEKNGWLYLCYFLFYSYFLMQVKNELGWSVYLGIFCLLNVLMAPAVIFTFVEDRVGERNWIYWLTWTCSFVLIPLVIMWVVQYFSWAKWMGLAWMEDGWVIIVARDLVISSVLIYWLLKLTQENPVFLKFRKRLRRLSFFKLAMIIFALLALALPFFTNDFQNMLNDRPVGQWFFSYLIFIPQIFIIYASYYLYYYIHHYFLFNKVLQRKGVIAYLLGCIGLILLLTPILNSVFDQFPVIKQLTIHPLGATGIQNFDDITYIFPLIAMIFSFPIIVLIEWNKKSTAMQTLEQEKTKAELSLLKQQINPHFFFNTLNNLYALSLEKSDLTPETILKLSKLMRFVIYKGAEEYVRVEDEVNYLKDYIDLQKLRLNTPFELKMDIKVENDAQPIPPLMLINLVENAFKHGIQPSEKPGYIHLLLEVNPKQLKFRLQNSVDPEKGDVPAGGMGLQNLRKRLQIRYPKRHELEISEGQTFEVTLYLDL
ncbi:sensor histidine kinase [Portibacter marinus]|uniref:sensor histidine kinase n=1 Tax=Portibacter marinus TaxID=2898660 RepID=UPI001F1B1913|nr:sensor histidine kinase [Portibacter marinus]